MLPSDLRQAESQALQALRSALASRGQGRWTVELRFEGLRLMPVALRLAKALVQLGEPLQLVFADAGSAALARRDDPDQAELISTLSDQRRQQEQGDLSSQPEGVAPPLLLLVSPSPSDYELVEGICLAHGGPVALLNATLEAGAVGLGSVARARRKGFLAQWQTAYALQPFAASALRRAHPGEWELYRLDPDGFRLARCFSQKPTAEEQAEALSGESSSGLQQQMRALGDLIDNLQG